MEQLGHNPSPEAAALYVGDVMHARLKPMSHRFSYRVLSLLVDLDHLDEADRLTRLFGVNRRALYSFHERDHGPRDGSSLRAHVDRQLAEHGIDLDDGRVLLLAYPRIAGYAFNPLAVYYCYDRSGAMAALIYEVRNTFGEMHAYVCPLAPGEVSAAGIRQERDKAFYVSPFIAMGMRYRFRMHAPDDVVKVRILETDADGPLLSATFCGERKRMTTASLLAAFCRLPFMTLKVIAGIHFEAARLWLKGARLHARPRHIDTEGADGPVAASHPHVRSPSAMRS
jgi:DUF1365 family protein